jgi:rubrerythrin
MTDDSQGGDAVCWLNRVCPDCGRLDDGPRPGVCPACGAPLEDDPHAAD